MRSDHNNTDLRVSLQIDVDALLVVVTALLSDLLEVIPCILYLSIQQVPHPLCNGGVLFGGSLGDGAGPPVAVGKVQLYTLRGAVNVSRVLLVLLLLPDKRRPDRS